MARYRDRHGVGKSAIVPRKRGESWKARHARRKTHANLPGYQAAVARWCVDNFATLAVKNDGHHFLINPIGWPLRPEGVDASIHFAQWWPSSAKLVIAGKWDNGVHVHDVMQLIEQLDAIVDKAYRNSFVARAINYSQCNTPRPRRQSQQSHPIPKGEING